MRIDVYEDKQGQWRWRFVAANGRIIADSAEGYSTESNCRRAVNMVLRDVEKYAKRICRQLEMLQRKKRGK